MYIKKDTEAITVHDKAAKQKASKQAFFKAVEGILLAAADTTTAAKMGLDTPVINMPTKAWIEMKKEQICQGDLQYN